MAIGNFLTLSLHTLSVTKRIFLGDYHVLVTINVVMHLIILSTTIVTLISYPQLCSQFRLLPEMYLRCKEAMMTEFARVGKLRLMDARRLCRIDVNKTRKIYNLLVSKGFISS